MSIRATMPMVALLLAVRGVTADVAPDIAEVAHCQKQFASAGASFAQKVIRATLKCTDAVTECQVQCDGGVFGPSCNDSPPPCCDSDDPSSNQAFGECMTGADEVCAQQDVKMAQYEVNKQTKIINACSGLTTDELCGADGEGLNFATLNAGCLALDPSYTCTLQNLINCVGGPLERQLTDQISSLLDARAGDGVGALNLESSFPGIPVTRKVKETLPAGKRDLWSISGQAGDLFVVRVKTHNDNGDGTSNLHPGLTLLDASQQPVADTNVKNVPCGVPNVCGGSCQAFRRTLPFNGTYYIAVGGLPDAACTGGAYRLFVTSPSGIVPTLAQDDVP